MKFLGTILEHDLSGKIMGMSVVMKINSVVNILYEEVCFRGTNGTKINMYSMTSVYMLLEL